jgi:hypothetical protein
MHEAAGVVFAYMGPKEKKPLFPNLEWLSVPETHVGAMKFLVENNYLQGIEGDCDTSYVGYLHLGNRTNASEEDIAQIGAQDRAPQFENEITWCGIRSVASRNVGDGMKSVDIFSYIMRFIACVPAGKKNQWRVRRVSDRISDAGRRLPHTTLQLPIQAQRSTDAGKAERRSSSNRFNLSADRQLAEQLSDRTRQAEDG